MSKDIKFNITLNEKYYEIIDNIKKDTNTTQFINDIISDPELLNLQDKNGNTILIFASILKKFDIINQILKKLNKNKICFDIDLVNIKGNSFFDYYFKSIDHNENDVLNVLHYLVKTCNFDIYFTNKIGLNRFNYINSLDNTIYSDLFAKYNIQNIKKNTKYFFDNYRNIIIKGPQNTDITILMFLTIYDEVELIKYLFTNYSPVNILYTNSNGENALKILSDISVSYKNIPYIIDEAKASLNREEYLKYVFYTDSNINLMDDTIMSILDFYYNDTYLSETDINYRNKLRILLNNGFKINIFMSTEYIQIQSLLISLTLMNDYKYNDDIKNIKLFKKYIENTSEKDIIEAINFKNVNGDNCLTYAIISEVDYDIIELILSYKPEIQEKVIEESIVKDYLNKKDFQKNLLQSEKAKKEIETQEKKLKDKVEKQQKTEKKKIKKKLEKVGQPIEKVELEVVKEENTELEKEIKYSVQFREIDDIIKETIFHDEKVIYLQNEIINLQNNLENAINQLQMNSYDVINKDNSSFIFDKTYFSSTNCDIIMCGILSIVCYYSNTKEDMKESIGVHGLWPETKFKKYKNSKNQTKNFKKLEELDTNINIGLKYTNFGNYIENNKNKYSCHPILEEDLKKIEWNKHGIYANNYENVDEYFIEMCQLGKPIINLIKKHICESIIDEQTYDFESIKNIITSSTFNQYLKYIKDDSKIDRNIVDKSFYSQEFYFNICRIKLRINNKDVYRWKFCINDINQVLS
jgi:hypothetical protein